MVHKNVIVMINWVQNDQFWRKNLLKTTQIKSKIFRSVIKIHSYKKILKELRTALKIRISAGNGPFKQAVILMKYSILRVVFIYHIFSYSFRPWIVSAHLCMYCDLCMGKKIGEFEFLYMVLLALKGCST